MAIRSFVRKNQHKSRAPTILKTAIISIVMCANQSQDAWVAEKMAAMSMQMGRIKPVDSTKRRQVSVDGTDRRTKTVMKSQFFTLQKTPNKYPNRQLFT
jgi:hypothetical protein